MEREQSFSSNFFAYQLPVAVSSEVMDATSAFQETDLTALLNIQHALDAGTDLLSSWRRL